MIETAFKTLPPDLQQAIVVFSKISKILTPGKFMDK